MQKFLPLFIFGLLVFGVSVDMTYAAKVTEPTPALLKEWQQRGGFSHDLDYDMWSSDVTFLRRALGGKSTRSDVPYKYDTEIETLVKEFQKSERLKQTGEFDTKTRTALNDLFMERLCPSEGSRKDLSGQHITKDSRVPQQYIPQKLIVLEEVKTAVPLCVERETATALTKMSRAAEKDGVTLMVTSGYRSPAMQEHLHDYWTSIEGKDAAHKSAKPGYSEHQLGTAVDLTDASIQYRGVDDAFAKSAGGIWLQKHAHKYGFTMSYQKGKQDVTGFDHEPWHWRYVGKNVATVLKKQKITFAEYNTKKVSKSQLVSKTKKVRVE